MNHPFENIKLPLSFYLLTPVNEVTEQEIEIILNTFDRYLKVREPDKKNILNLLVNKEDECAFLIVDHLKLSHPDYQVEVTILAPDFKKNQDAKEVYTRRNKKGITRCNIILDFYREDNLTLTQKSVEYIMEKDDIVKPYLKINLNRHLGDNHGEQ